MQTFSTLKKEFLEKLKEFPFETEEEAHAMGLKHFTLVPSESYRALDSSFTFKKKTKKKEGKEKQRILEISVSEESEEKEKIEIEDIFLDMDLFINNQQIIENTQVKLIKNEKYGLIGRNGTGKTTLLRAIKNKAFNINKKMRIHLIKQEFNSKKRVIDYVKGLESLKLLGFSTKDNTKDNKSDKDNNKDNKSDKDNINNINKDININNKDINNNKNIIINFDFNFKNTNLAIACDSGPSIYENICNLSGGWKMRVQLAKAIYRNPDLLLLDEPTNFLDIKSINFLIDFIKNFKTTVIVSHDRNFLNKTCNFILHLSDCKIKTYRGNYASFLSLRDRELKKQVKDFEAQQLEIAALMSFINRFRYNAKRSSQVQSRIKVLEKMPRVEPPRKEPLVKFSFPSETMKNLYLEFRDFSFGYGPGKKILRKINFRLSFDSRVVIVGSNGEGKSTLLKIIAGELCSPAKDTLILSEEIKKAYFAQEHIDQLNFEENSLEFMMRLYPEEEARRRMANFGLKSSNLIKNLSGGQKSRLTFSSLKKSNLLVLDEPTNHLDISMINALSEAIKEYKGAVVCVSHDLSFVESCFKEVFVCEGGDLVKYKGSVSEYIKNNI